jgi:hypothetical protein
VATTQCSRGDEKINPRVALSIYWMTELKLHFSAKTDFYRIFPAYLQFA